MAHTTVVTPATGHADRAPVSHRTRTYERGSPWISRDLPPFRFGDKELGGPAFRSRSATAAGPWPGREIRRSARRTGYDGLPATPRRSGRSAWQTAPARANLRSGTVHAADLDMPKLDSCHLVSY